MQPIQTTITAVVVYPDRARLARRGTAALEAGLQQVQIAGLPLRLDPSSVRAAARGTARARLLGVQVQREFFAETPVEQVRALENQLEAAEDELRRLGDWEERVQEDRKARLRLSDQAHIFATALASGEMSLETQRQFYEGLRQQAAELDAELQEIARQQREQERQVQKLKQELDRWRGLPKREQYRADVELEVLEGGELEVELSYVVAGAAWAPLYDLRLREENGQESAGKPVLEVGYLAQVTQRTGEAWDNVRLTLSTARPALAGRLPELDPWYVGPLPPPPPPHPRKEVAYAMAAPAPEAKMRKLSDAAAEVPAEVATAEVSSTGAAVTYTAAGDVSIPGDGAPHKVTIANFSLEPRLDYVTAPRLTPAVYRRARVNNLSPYTLLPGQANLFAGEDFIGAARLELTAPEAEIELYLGTDDRIQVERELKRREVDKRLIGSRRRDHAGYEITLHNLLPVEAHLTLHDQIPVSRHEEVKVRLESADPRPTEQDELNRLRWEFVLAPKEKRVVRFDFSVESPPDMVLTGLGM